MNVDREINVDIVGVVVVGCEYGFGCCFVAGGRNGDLICFKVLFIKLS